MCRRRSADVHLQDCRCVSAGVPAPAQLHSCRCTPALLHLHSCTPADAHLHFCRCTSALLRPHMCGLMWFSGGFLVFRWFSGFPFGFPFAFCFCFLLGFLRVGKSENQKTKSQKFKFGFPMVFRFGFLVFRFGFLVF